MPSNLFARRDAPSPDPGTPRTDTSPLFARFPHLSRIELLWGSSECREYLNSLVMDSRNGQRQGFPAEHAAAILRLVVEHDVKFPQFQPGERAWGFASQR